MLSREDNELLTRTGPGTPMGKLMRRYCPDLHWTVVPGSHRGCKRSKGASTPATSPFSIAAMKEMLTA